MGCGRLSWVWCPLGTRPAARGNQVDADGLVAPVPGRGETSAPASAGGSQAAAHLLAVFERSAGKAMRLFGASLLPCPPDFDLRQPASNGALRVCAYRPQARYSVAACTHGVTGSV